MNDDDTAFLSKICDDMPGDGMSLRVYAFDFLPEQKGREEEAEFWQWLAAKGKWPETVPDTVIDYTNGGRLVIDWNSAQGPFGRDWTYGDGVAIPPHSLIDESFVELLNADPRSRGYKVSGRASFESVLDAVLALRDAWLTLRRSTVVCPYCSGEGCAAHGHGDPDRKCDGSGRIAKKKIDLIGRFVRANGDGTVSAITGTDIIFGTVMADVLGNPARVPGDIVRVRTVHDEIKEYVLR